MTKKELIQELDKLKSETFGYNPESAHEKAEKLIMEYLKQHDKNIYDKFQEVKGSYGWWCFG